MSIPVLTQVYDEVRRLSIAGSVVAADDFRLKKLIPALEQSGQKAPVFAKVAQGVAKLVESPENSSAEALLELSMLVNAILYTQGETGLAGQLQPIETTDLGQQQTQVSARILKPLLDALTTTGSGRLEIIKDAYERDAFRDLRLVKPALAALDDAYPEIGDFIAEKVLPLYGRAILPELRAAFDQKGRAGHVRRLALMHQLDPEGSRETVKRALDEGSKEVRVVAIGCLGSSPEDLAFLLEQVKSKAKDVREAALKALAQSDAAEAVAALRGALNSADLQLAVAPIRSSRNPELLKHVLDDGASLHGVLLAGKEKDKKAVGQQVDRFLSLLECLRGRGDKASEAFLIDCFQKRDKLSAIKSEPGGKDIEQLLVSLLALGSKKAQQTLIEAHASLAAEDLPAAFIAACSSLKPAEVFAMFSPYLTAKVDEKKGKRDPAFAKREAIGELIANRWNWQWNRYNSQLYAGADFLSTLDSRWLDVAVQQKNLMLVQALARPGHAAAGNLLATALKAERKASKGAADYSGILQALVRVEHPEATDAVIAAIQKRAKDGQTYGYDWLGRLITQLPSAAVPKLEALLPSLPEKVIDQLVDYVAELKNRQ